MSGFTSFRLRPVTVGKETLFGNKNHSVVMRRLKGHELGPESELRTPKTGRGEFCTPKTIRVAWDDHHSSSAELPVSGRRTQDRFSCKEAQTLTIVPKLWYFSVVVWFCEIRRPVNF